MYSSSPFNKRGSVVRSFIRLRFLVPALTAALSASVATWLLFELAVFRTHDFHFLFTTRIGVPYVIVLIAVGDFKTGLVKIDL